MLKKFGVLYKSFICKFFTKQESTAATANASWDVDDGPSSMTSLIRTVFRVYVSFTSHTTKTQPPIVVLLFLICKRSKSWRVIVSPEPKAFMPSSTFPAWLFPSNVMSQTPPLDRNDKSQFMFVLGKIFVAPIPIPRT